MIGRSANNTQIFYKVGDGSYDEIENLMEIPELGGAPEKVDVTVLSDSIKRYIHGKKEMGDLAFKFLYDNSEDDSNYRLLKNLEKNNTVADFKVTYPDGTNHEFKSLVWLKMDAGTVNGALTFSCNMTMQSDITVTKSPDTNSPDTNS